MNHSKIDLSPINEMLAAHEAYLASCGYVKGQPPKKDGKTIGNSLYEACIVLLSAKLEAFIGDELERAIRKKFLHIKKDEEIKSFIKKIGYIGNPKPETIDDLFMYVGIINIMSDLTWSQNIVEDRKWMTVFNQMRNKISHGKSVSEIVVDGTKISLTKGEVREWRDWIELFAKKFPAHLDQRIN